MSETIVNLPQPAQAQITAMQSEMKALQNAMQQFVNGVLIGMGHDVSKPIKVDLDAMTATLTDGEE